MTAIRQYFWLFLGIGIIILDGAVALIFYLIFRRVYSTNQYQFETGIKKFFMPSCVRNTSLNKSSKVQANDNTYQIDKEYDGDNTVDEVLKSDSMSHDYESPSDYEQQRMSGYVDVLPEDGENYDDVIAPGWLSEDYDDIAEVNHLAHQPGVSSLNGLND
ncbi:uncharacterized protein LOC144501452 [Mustelus asterias]